MIRYLKNGQIAFIQNMLDNFKYIKFLEVKTLEKIFLQNIGDLILYKKINKIKMKIKY